MGAWKKFTGRVSGFFFPPEGTPRWLRILPYAIMGVLTLLALTAGAYGWEYTNSPPFCGESCHTMPPEYTSYLISPHARVDCVDCHIGKGFIATRITRKAGDLKHVFATVFKNYEFPISARALRPARETCELCHSPQKFSDDSLREIRRFGDDRYNTPTSTFLVVKTGGGSQREGLGRGIHWHIENEITYLPTDNEEQEIPYVRVVNADGSVSEFFDVENKVDPASIDPAQLVEMDCITCHNRITHMIFTPEDTVDTLMERGIISTDIPDIHLKAVEVYGASYSSVQMGLNGIAGLRDYYKAYFADYYNANPEKVEDAIAALQTAYGSSIYPEQKADWNSHPSNVGHRNSPGCFRCHDGKHLTNENESIRLECNLCHSIPVVNTPQDFVANIEVSRGPEPETHTNSNWISMHNQAIDVTCANCHTTDNPGGADDSSFCSNSACHSSVWEYAGFDAPRLREIILSQLPPTPMPVPLPTGGALTYDDGIGPLLAARCGNCHVATSLAGLNVGTYPQLMAGGDQGAVINPDDPQSSLLVQKQSGEQPHFGQLSPEELDLVIQWIQAGAPEK